MAKRVNGSKKGFGKPYKPHQLDDLFDFEGLVNGTKILVAHPVEDEVKGLGDMFVLLTSDDLNDQSAIISIMKTAFSTACVNLAKQRFQNGRGLLTLTPRSYRRQWGLADESDGEIVFNWWNKSELKVAQERSYIFGGTRIIAEVAIPLVTKCIDRFPVIIHVVPFQDTDGNLMHPHLVFTVPFSLEQSKEVVNVIMCERETKPLI